MKRHGLSAFDNTRIKQYSELGQSLIRQKSSELSTQLQLFKSILLNFLDEHNDELSEDLDLRDEFIRTCSLVGIDPLQIYGKHTKMNEFYYELCVRIIEYSNKMKDINGGLIPVKQFLKEFKDQNVNRNDIEITCGMLRQLNEDMEIVTIGDREYLKNFHIEITNDQNVVFEIANELGFVTVRMLHDNLGWKSYKSKKVLDEMVSSGYLWVDLNKGEMMYWDPAWIERS
jgi:ESCRT-II complex subunit VPS22